MTLTEAREAWIARFYTDPNELDPETDELVAAWIARVRDGDRSFALPISVRRPDGRSVLGLVCIGLDTPASRDLQEEVKAFLDPTFTAVGGDGTPRSVDAISSLAVLAQLPDDQRLPDTARAFRVVLDGDVGLARAQALRLARLRARRPDLQTQSSRPLGLLIRDLRSALRRGEVTAARQLRDEIAQTGLLSAINLVGVTILCLEAEARWNDMLATPELRDIARIPLARDVVGALLRGVYNVNVHPHRSASPSELIKHFDQSILLEGDLGGLFRNARWVTTDEERATWALFAAAQSPADIALLDEVAAGVSQDSAVRDIVDRVQDYLGGHAVVTPGIVKSLGQASQLISDGNYSSAQLVLEGLHDADPVALARLHIFAAAGLGDPSLAEQAVERLHTLPEEAQSALYGDPVIAGLVERQLKPLLSSAGAAIDQWHAWFVTLAQGGATPALTSAYRDFGDDWSVEDVLNDPSVVDTLLAIGTGNPAGTALLLEALPSFVDSLIRTRDRTGDNRTTQALVCSAELLGLSDHLGRNDLSTLLEIVESLSSDGLDPSDYRRLLHGSLLPAWQYVASPHHAPWIADVLAALWEYPSPDQDARVAFVTAVQATLIPLAKGLNLETAIALEDSLEALGAPTVLRPLGDAAEEQWHSLANKKVFVYSLREPSAKRAVDWMSSKQPSASFFVASDIHPSKQTIDNAKHADILVIVTSAATHAATLAIEHARRDDALVKYPLGTGWAGIVTSVRDSLVPTSTY